MKLPPEQEAIRAKCFHPSGKFVEFSSEDVETSIPKRFEKIVRMYPERVAIKTKARSLTYDSLNKWANCMANELLARCGFGQRPVALLLSKDIYQCAAIFGVLKAGKMYEVLEPSYPRARIRFILDALQTTLLVTDSSHFSLAQSVARAGEQIFDIEALDLNL